MHNIQSPLCSLKVIYEGSSSVVKRNVYHEINQLESLQTNHLFQNIYHTIWNHEMAHPGASSSCWKHLPLQTKLLLLFCLCFTPGSRHKAIRAWKLVIWHQICGANHYVHQKYGTKNFKLRISDIQRLEYVIPINRELRKLTKRIELKNI